MDKMLDFNLKGTAVMEYVRVPPWNEIGRDLSAYNVRDDVVNGKTIQEAAGQTFTVRLEPFYIRMEDAASAAGYRMISLPNHLALVRSGAPYPDNLIAIVGSSYSPIQSSSLYDVGDALVNAGIASYHLAGILRGGRNAWLLMKMFDTIHVTEQDEVEKYILITTSHERRQTGRVNFLPIRLVCQNTLSVVPIPSAKAARIAHRGKDVWSFKTVDNLIRLCNNTFSKTAKVYDALVKTRITEEQVKFYIGKLIPDTPNRKHKGRTELIRGRILRLFYQGAGNSLAETKGTAWAAYNAITEYIDHVKSAWRSAECRLWASWFVGGRNLRTKAFKYARKLIV